MTYIKSDKLFQFAVWCKELGQTEEDAKTISAGFPDTAAKIWGQLEDAHSADYWIVGGQTATVYVKDNTGKILTYLVYGESVPEYFSRLITQELK